MLSRGVVLATSRRKASVGAAANGMAATPLTWKLRSGTQNLGHRSTGTIAQCVEEIRQFRPNLCASGETAPMRADQPHQLVTFVDRSDVVFVRLRGQTVDEQGLHIGFHGAESGTR